MNSASTSLSDRTSSADSLQAQWLRPADDVATAVVDLQLRFGSPRNRLRQCDRRGDPLGRRARD